MYIHLGYYILCLGFVLWYIIFLNLGHQTCERSAFFILFLIFVCRPGYVIVNGLYRELEKPDVPDYLRAPEIRFPSFHRRFSRNHYFR